ncbi:hypothetical protein D6C87_03845 [Aureobasidium pullulans]|nr:hypothetical protein D6C87_03845 [Aureobasidium pullulans]
MSFGFGIGDFKAVAEVVIKVIDRVKSSPDQIKNTRQDVEAISAFIESEETNCLNGAMSPAERAQIQESLESCKGIVQDLQSELSKFGEASHVDKGIRAKFKRSIQSLKWDQQANADTRSRVLLSLDLLEKKLRRLDSGVLHRTCAGVGHTQAGVERLEVRDDIRTKVLERQTQDAESQAILNWICPSELDYADQQEELLKKRQRGIGEWFLDSKDFKDWFDGDKTVLTCIGMPGVGKTMITSFVVSRVLDEYKDDAHIGVAYIFCQYSRHKEQTAEHLMSCILRQLLEQHSVIPDEVRSLYRSTKGKRRLLPDDMSDLLNTVMSNLTRSFIIVDALDELPSSTGVRDNFISELLAIGAGSKDKVYLTSRVPIEEAHGMRLSAELRIYAREDDMRYTVRTKLKKGPLFRNNVDLQNKVTSKILEAAKGVYLIAVLHAKHMSLFLDIGEVLIAFDDIDHSSDSYKTVYEQTLRRVTSDDNPMSKRNLALTILCYLFFAKRPLRIEELSHALAVREGSVYFDEDHIPDVAVIIRSCAGLIVLDDSSNMVNMFHKSLHDYLVEYHTDWIPNGDEFFGKTCISYLSLDNFADGPCPEVDPSSLWSRCLAQDKTILMKKRFVEYPFYGYASQHWYEHVRGSDSEAADVVLRFLANGKKVSASCQTLECTAPETTGVHIAVRTSLERSLKRHLQLHRPQLNTMDSDGRTPLSYAAGLNSLEAVRLLISAGADPNLASEAKGYGGFTPLLCAASRGHENTVSVLIDNGANVRSKDREGRNALTHASECGSRAVTRLLLDRGADPNAKDLSQRTPLFYAAAAGSKSVVTLLLEQGVQVNLKDRNGETPLLLAAKAGSDSLISALIAGGADVNAQVWQGDTPLSRAVGAGLESAVELLLKSGAEVDCFPSDDFPLHRALQIGSKAIVRLLVSAGVDVSKRGRKSVPPLAYAAQNGWADIIQLLLDNGAEVDKIDGSGQTILAHAVESGSIESVVLLIKNGAVINRANRSSAE